MVEELRKVIGVGEVGADVEKHRGSGCGLDEVQEDTHLSFNRCGRGPCGTVARELQVQRRRQLARIPRHGGEEVPCLLRPGCTEGEEVVGATVQARRARLPPIGRKAVVDEIAFFRRLDVGERRTRR